MIRRGDHLSLNGTQNHIIFDDHPRSVLKIRVVVSRDFSGFMRCRIDFILCKSTRY